MSIKLCQGFGQLTRYMGKQPGACSSLFFTRGVRGSRYRQDFIEQIKKEHEGGQLKGQQDEDEPRYAPSTPAEDPASNRVDFTTISSKLGRKTRVQELLKSASTYSDLNDPPGADPFLSTPYVKGTPKPEIFNQELPPERPKQDPSTASIVLFPGQGSQYIGMCGDVSSAPPYISMLYNTASEILEYDLLDACMNGPKSRLDKTAICQPAILVSSIAALEKLREEREDIEKTCVAAVGFSVGELAAFVFSGVLSFEDAVRVAKVRSQAMHLACELEPSAMATVFYGADSKLNFALLVAREWCAREYKIKDPVCSIANYLFPHCKVVAGHIQAIEFLEANYKDFKLRKVKRLPVEGAFHTDLMKPAEEPLKAVLDLVTVNEPRIPIYSNATAKRYHGPTDIKKNFRRQLHLPVKWEQILHELYHRPKATNFPSTFEVGPGTSLSTILKLVNAKAYSHSKRFSLKEPQREERRYEEM